MEFFDKDTEHIKYLDTLSGKFTYRSKSMLFLSALVGFGLICAAARFVLFRTPYIVPAVLAVLFAVALHIPCSYSADEDGFSIVSGLVSRHFSYSDVVSVTVENRVWGHTRGGEIYENVLIVSTTKGIYRFRESCGTVRRRSLMYVPNSDCVSGRHTELLRLREFISSRL